MRRLLFTAAAMLIGCTACLAQVSTMGSTAMGLSSTPGAIVTSPLNGPSPFSATTQPGTPVTTLAPVPLASDPTIPGTVVTCSTPTGQITPGTPAVPITSLSSTAGTTGTMPPISAALTTSAAPAASSASGDTTTPLLTQPATSFMTDLPGSTAPPQPSPALPPLPLPSIAVMPIPTSPTVPSTTSTSVPGTTTTMGALTTTMSPSAMAPAASLGTIPTPIV